jgi:hypothetical protein
MGKIDLDAIQLKYVSRSKETVWPTNEQVREMMKEAIHQALVLACENATASVRGQGDYWAEIDEESIMEVEKMIV